MRLICQADSELYLAASSRLLDALRGMESTLRAEGHNLTLLCPERLAAYQQETSYLGAFSLRQFMPELGGGGGSAAPGDLFAIFGGGGGGQPAELGEQPLAEVPTLP